uniref:Vesicle transport protein USE1 n=1 Tax=Cacopsylla melanoneura TaxID=428564 RepID=A0A8D9BGT3_9HEMI
MVLSRTEINIKRLLARCEFMVDENNEENNWRIEKYVEGLEDMILTLKKENDEQDQAEDMDKRLNNDAITSYVKRKDFLKGYLNTKKVNNVVSKVISMQSLPIVSDSSDHNIPNEIYQKVTNRYLEQTRDQLFDRSEVFSMKQNDLDSVLGDEHKVQERIVESMLDMVQNIKQRSVAANQIIKQDIASAEKSSCLADVNQDKMRINNDTLGVFNKGAYKCWLWVMLGFVFITFFYMIMFIKLFKKKS